MFNPKLSARQLVKEGRALKLAATLSAPRREQVVRWGLSIVGSIESARCGNQFVVVQEISH